MSGSLLRVSNFIPLSPLHFTLQSLPPVYDIIFDHLSPLNLIHVSLTCKDGLKAIGSYKHHAFSINRILSRFFTDPLAFRSLQARTGALISGSQALQFFRRCHWPGSDLDIYTWPGHTMEVGLWLLKEGYIFFPSSFQPPNILDIKEEELAMDGEIWESHIPTTEIDIKHLEMYAITGIRMVLTFKKQIGDNTLTVQIITPKLSPIEVILHFHSTAVMNFISWNKAYSLYPYATLEKSRSLIGFVPDSPSPQYDKALIKYNARGFTMVASVYPHEDKRCAFHSGYRHVGDSYTWGMPLETKGVQSPDPHPFTSLQFDRYLANGWEMKITMDSTGNVMNTHIARLHAYHHLIRCSILRYTYTAPKSFIDYAIPFFIAQGRLEHAKLTAAEAEIYGGRRNSKPSFWHFYDEEFIELLHQWIHEGTPSVSGGPKLVRRAGNA